MSLTTLFHPLATGLRQGLGGPHPSFTAEENYAAYRYGPEPPDLQQEQAVWRRLVRRRRGHFARTWDRLEDDDSKAALLESLVFRVLGWQRMKRRRNTSTYRAIARTLPERSPRFPVLEARLRPVRHKFLNVHDVPELGLRLATTDGFFLNVLVNRQYHLERRERTIRVEPGDVVLDGGTGWGDTAVLFAHEAGPHGRVFTFDFVPSNLAVLERNLELNPDLCSRIATVRHALSEKSGEEVAFRDRGTGTSLAQGGEERARTVAIDDFVESERLAAVNFIKMDIEGAEEAALRGAARTLRQHRPKLAICAYHRPQDLYALADCIAKIEPAYRFWLDHHTIHSEETVLYAAARR